MIGWICIAGAILIILSGGIGSAAFSVMQHMGGERPSIPEEAPFQFNVMEVIFQHFGLLAIPQVVVAILIIITSIQFLRLRRWASTTLEVIAWLGLVYVVGFGIFWVTSWIGITSNIPLTEGTQEPSPCSTLSALSWAPFSLFLGCPSCCYHYISPRENDQGSTFVTLQERSSVISTIQKAHNLTNYHSNSRNDMCQKVY